jgi:hypothetical protein
MVGDATAVLAAGNRQPRSIKSDLFALDTLVLARHHENVYTYRSKTVTETAKSIDA